MFSSRNIIGKQFHFIIVSSSKLAELYHNVHKCVGKIVSGVWVVLTMDCKTKELGGVSCIVGCDTGIPTLVVDLHLTDLKDLTVPRDADVGILPKRDAILLPDDGRHGDRDVNLTVQPCRIVENDYDVHRSVSIHEEWGN